MALVAIIPEDWAFFTGIITGGIGTGLQLPGLNNLVTSAASTEQRAGITSIYGAVRFFGVAFGPPLYGALMKADEALPFWFSAILGLITLAITMLFIHPDKLMGPGGAGGAGGGKSQGKQLPGWQVPDKLPGGTRGDTYEPLG
jgi:ACDE family multidrug resistance protein